MLYKLIDLLNIRLGILVDKCNDDFIFLYVQGMSSWWTKEEEPWNWTLRWVAFQKYFMQRKGKPENQAII